MRLDRLSIINFKNIESEEISLTAGINCFVGDNGAGKTNILDAVHYLSMSKLLLAVRTTLENFCVASISA